jgi:hypothetical protein
MIKSLSGEGTVKFLSPFVRTTSGFNFILMTLMLLRKLLLQMRLLLLTLFQKHRQHSVKLTSELVSALQKIKQS